MPEFFLPNPKDFTVNFDKNHELFTTTAATISVTKYAGDSFHPTCMKVSVATTGKGVYADVSNVGAGVKHAVEFAYRCVGSQAILVNVYDQTNGATFAAATLGGSAQPATNWSNYYKEVTTPAGCSTIRLMLKQNNANTKTEFYIDNVKIHGNALYVDPDAPDGYTKAYPDVHNDHQNVDGSITRDRTGRHVSFNMRMPVVDNASFQRLLELSRSVDPTYFNDGNVPAMTQSATLRSVVTGTYTGVTVGNSATHRAYYTATTAVPVTAAVMQAASFTTTRYQQIDQDDGNYVTEAISGTGKFGYHKFKFVVTGYTSETVLKFSAKWKGLVQDSSDNNVDGADLMAWDGNNWAVLDRSRTPDKQTLSFTTSKKAIAQQFVDTASNLVRLIVRTRGAKDTTGTLAMQSHYVEVRVNEHLGRRIELLNRAVLTAAGSAVEVKNITDNQVLTLATTGRTTTGYNIGDDRKYITVTADQDNGDEIRVKYNQYYNVVLENLSEPRIYGGDINAPDRQVNLSLRTVTPIEVIE